MTKSIVSLCEQGSENRSGVVAVVFVVCLREDMSSNACIGRVKETMIQK